MKKMFFLLFPALISAQVKGIARDAETGEPIPYVNVWVLGENIGMLGDSLGNYTVNTTNADKTIVFSAAGYQTVKLKLPETRKLLMMPIPAVANTQVMQNQITAGVANAYDKSDVKLTYASHGQPWMMAKKFPSRRDDKTPFVKTVTLLTDCNQEKSRFILRLMDVAEDGSPGQDLLGSAVFVHPEKGKNDTSVDLSSYAVEYPEKGFFVVVEWMITPDNIRYRRDKNVKGPKEYEPALGAIPGGLNSTWGYQLGKWTEFGKSGVTGMKEFKDQFVDLAIKLTLTN